MSTKPAEPVGASQQAREPRVTEEMVSRFLNWRLPANFSPDGGITFKPLYNEHMPWGGNRYEPSGTNLLDADQAKAMLEHVLAAPQAAPESAGAEPTLYVSAGQLENLKNLESEFGCYLPAYKTPIGKFTTPLYRAPQAPAPEPAKYDEVLIPFVAMMRKELHANSGKGDRPGWLSMTRQVAMLEIWHHAAKLQKAALNADTPAIQEHAADVANMAMMLLDVCGGIDAPQAPALEQIAEVKT